MSSKPYFDDVAQQWDTMRQSFFSENVRTKALAVADRAYVLETGKISMSGSAKELAEDDRVRKAYLGA